MKNTNTRPLRLSFVLPCYNVERYIGDCLDSLFQQDIPTSEYEVICVDDCSKDATSQIIANYQLKYSSIRLIRHKQNKTAGGARNTGIEHAQGKYIWFVDPDDLVRPNMLGHLLSLCEANALDELLFNHEIVDENLNFVRLGSNFTNSTVCKGTQYVERYHQNKLSGLSIVWQELYSTDFLRNKSIRFPELRIGQDGPFAWNCLLSADKIMSIGDIAYTYRLNGNSVSSDQQKRINGFFLFTKSILFGMEIVRLRSEMELSDSMKAELDSITAWSVNSFIPALYSAKISELSNFQLLCNQHTAKLVELSPFLNSKSKRVLSGIKMNRSLYFVWVKFVVSFDKLMQFISKFLHTVRSNFNSKSDSNIIY